MSLSWMATLSFILLKSVRVTTREPKLEGSKLVAVGVAGVELAGDVLGLVALQDGVHVGTVVDWK